MYSIFHNSEAVFSDENVFQDSSPHRHDLGSHEDKKHDRLENITQARPFHHSIMHACMLVVIKPLFLLLDPIHGLELCTTPAL
jgi:hypothetical protein